MSKLNSAKEILRSDLVDAPHVHDNLWGNATTMRKIENYVIESVKAGVGAGDCTDWFNDLLNEFEIEDKGYSSTLSFMFNILNRYINS